MTVLGAVLCGGASRRMGRDKALVAWHGRPMVATVAAALAEGGCAEVVAVGGDRAALVPLGLRVVDDQHPGEGPLAGVLAALAEADGRAAVVVACDLPMLTAATVRRLITAPPADVVAATSSRLEPLCARWSPEARSLLRALFASGERALWRVVRDLDLRVVPAVAGELRNVNSPADLGK